MRDLRANLAGIQSVVPIIATTTPAVVAVDRRVYEGLVFYVLLGAGGITFTGTNKITLVIEESDDNSTWNFVAAADCLGGTPDVNGIFKSYIVAKAAASVDEIGYIGNKRYVRVTPTYGGTHSSGTATAVCAVLGYPREAPVS